MNSHSLLAFALSSTCATLSASIARAQPLQDEPRAESAAARIRRVFHAFDHVPFDESGFDVLSLPFRYRDETRSGDRGEANAFAFLLSDALDWTPGAYSARHAYFVFKRSRKQMQPLTRQYDVDAIAALVGDWGKSHAVGGALVRTVRGWTGALEIYDARGLVLLDRRYDEPRPYFELLGDVCVDAMAHFGFTANEALVRLVHEPRCAQFQSIVKLGHAAFVEERGEREFGLYESILEADPDFAEVRVWHANQRYWKEGDVAQTHLDYARSLKSRLTPTALDWFSPTLCPDAELAAEHPRWIEAVEKLVGRDCRPVLESRLVRARVDRRIEPELLQRAFEYVRARPNEYQLLLHLAELSHGGAALPADGELSASLFAAALFNRYQPGAGKYYVLERFAGEAVELGRSDLALVALGEADPEDADEDVPYLSRALSYQGQAGQALIALRGLRAESTDSGTARAALEIAVAGVIADDRDVVRSALATFGAVLDGVHAKTPLEAWLAAPAGASLDLAALRKDLPRDDRAIEMLGILLLTAIDARLGGDVLRTELRATLRKHPQDRLAWQIRDLYERRAPSDDAAAFYRALAWMHAEDAWVLQAAADAQARAPHGADAPPAPIEDRLGAMAADRTPKLDDEAKERARAALRGVDPWVVADCVRDSIERGAAARAQDIAVRYHAACFHAGVEYFTRAFATQLVRRADEAVARGTPR